ACLWPLLRRILFFVLAVIPYVYTLALHDALPILLAFLVVPLLRSLKWINGFVGNYGWSIIFLTVIINAIMFPLRHKSVVSMRKIDRKSTRLNSSHGSSSYAVFCLKKKWDTRCCGS